MSFYEADAFARWAGARLPTEAEWEVAAAPLRGGGQLRRERTPAPRARRAAGGAQPALRRRLGVDARAPTRPTPATAPPAGALGEYNGKFMCNQLVLRGGSCATPRSHIRASYRNFFPPDARWQFTGIRLARDAARV